MVGHKKIIKIWYDKKYKNGNYTYVRLMLVSVFFFLENVSTLELGLRMQWKLWAEGE